MKLGNIRNLLAGSPFEDRAPEIEHAFTVAGVDTLEKLDNGPRYFGKSLAGYSAYQVCSYVREAAINKAMEPAPIEIPSIPEEVAELLATDEEE